MQGNEIKPHPKIIEFWRDRGYELYEPLKGIWDAYDQKRLHNTKLYCVVFINSDDLRYYWANSYHSEKEMLKLIKLTAFI